MIYPQSLNKKYFIAITLPEPVLSEVEAIKQHIFEKFNLKGALRSPAHITIHRPFEWKESKEGELLKAVSEFEITKPFMVELRNFNSFDKRVIYIDVLLSNELNKLYSEFRSHIRQSLGITNEWNNSYGFTPHVTVAFRDLRKHQFQTVFDEISKTDFNKSFEVSKISLLKLNEKWEIIN